MSGHSKWAGIKHKKAAADAKRANVFTRLANGITIAARHGGGDIQFNPALRAAVETARKANMPKDNVERAIKRGTGELGGAAVEELLYEGFGPGNVAILVAALTDNRNRTAPDIKLILTKNGGRFADGGGVAYLFRQQGVIRVQVGDTQAEQFEELVIEGGADDYRIGEGHGIAYVPTADLHVLRDAIEAAGFTVDSSDVEWVPNTPIEVGDEQLEGVANLIGLLEEHDDVTSVYTNLAE
jgi:YebC/PmpR family DNA-binding regulatory protein